MKKNITLKDIQSKIKKGTLPKQKFLFDDIPNYDVTLKDTDNYSFLKAEQEKGNVLFFKGNVPSLKNSKEIGKRWMTECCNSKYTKESNQYRCGKCGQIAKLKSIPSLRSSDLVLNYKKNNIGYFIQNKPLWRTISSGMVFPIVIGFYFVRETHSRFDFDNAKQIILDMFRDADYIPDDSAEYIRTVDIGYHKDANNSGVLVCVIDDISYKIKKKSDVDIIPKQTDFSDLGI